MSAVELKQRVINKLESIHEISLLEELIALIDFQTNEKPYSLTKAQKMAIDEARDQVKNGIVYTNEEVDKEMDQWLNK